MAQTISELEKERAELLRKIEEEARLAKQQSGTNDRDPAEAEMSLQDFLKAAQEVIPDDDKHLLTEPKTASTSNSPTPEREDTMARATKSNAKKTTTSTIQPSISHQKSTFFGVIIMFTLLLTVMGVMGLVYVTLNDAVESVASENQAQKQTVVELTKEVKQLKTATGVGPEAMEVQKKLEQIEKKLNQLERQVQSLKTSRSQQSFQASSSSQNISPDPNILVTQQILDEKFSQYTQHLEQKMDAKFNLILKYLKIHQQVPADRPDTQKHTPYQLPQRVKSTKIPKVKKVIPPKVSETLKPNAPVVTLVKPATQPNHPKVASASYTGDSHWLISQPLFNYTLQLASMTDKQQLESFKRRKGLKEGKIVPQKVRGQSRFVLILGSYTSKNEAGNQARKIKSQKGISPWIRKVKDLTSHLPSQQTS